MQFLLNSSRFAQTFYAKTGTGFPLILLHGFGEDSHIWEYQASSLEKEFMVIVPDIPGSGKSSLPADEMSMELIADFVKEIVDQEKLEKIILIGHSMGGYATLAFAEKYPDSLLGFALVHSSAFEDDDTKKETRRKSILLLQNNGKESFLKAMIPNLYSEDSRQHKESVIKQHLSMAMNTSSVAMVAYYEAMLKRPSRIHVLQHTKLPVQFVIGSEDQAVPLAISLKQCYLPDISKVDILEHTGHSSMFECPERLNSILYSFCKYVLDFKKH